MIFMCTLIFFLTEFSPKAVLLMAVTCFLFKYSKPQVHFAAFWSTKNFLPVFD